MAESWSKVARSFRDALENAKANAEKEGRKYTVTTTPTLKPGLGAPSNVNAPAWQLGPNTDESSWVPKGDRGSARNNRWIPSMPKQLGELLGAKGAPLPGEQTLPGARSLTQIIADALKSAGGTISSRVGDQVRSIDSIAASLADTGMGAGGADASYDGSTPYDHISTDLPDINVAELMERYSLQAPELQDYIGPYGEARTAANQSEAEARSSINIDSDMLRSSLDQIESDYADAVLGYDEQEATRRQFVEQAQARNLAPSGLAADLGLGPELGAQEGLLRAAQQMQLSGADNLRAETNRNQERAMQSQRAAAEQVRTGALSTAATNLSSILSEIGLGEAGAKRQYNQDANEILNANRQLQQQLEDEQRGIEAKEAELGIDLTEAKEQYRIAREELRVKEVEANAKLAEQFQTPKWDMQIESRMREYPDATKLLIEHIGANGREKNATNMAGALADLEASVQQYNADRQAEGLPIVAMDIPTLQQWLREYYTNQQVLDREGFLAAGGQL